MPDAPTKFIRIRLFIAYSFIAWYSLYNPKRSILLMEDFGRAEAERNSKTTVERMLSRTRKSKSPK